jgi:hypothetical protein
MLMISLSKRDTIFIGMKKKLLYSTMVLTLPLLSLSQDWGGLKPNGFWDHWSVNANAGMTSYFGDLSYHDSDISGKLTYESGPALGISVSKHFNKIFGISGELIYGNLQGGNNKNITFKTNLLEFNLQGRVDFLRLMFPHRQLKFGIEGLAGLGQFLFKSTTYELKGETQTSYIQETGVPEFVYFYGAGVHYHIGENFAVTAEMSLHHAQNDKLDNLIKNNNYDYYSYLSVGFTYYINSFKKEPLRNKARIAHSGIREN